MSASNKLSRIIAVFLCAFTFFGIITFIAPTRDVFASSYDVNAWDSGCTVHIKGKKDDSLTINLSKKVSKLDHVTSINNTWGCSAKIVQGDKTKIKVTITEDWGNAGFNCSFVKKKASPTTKATTKATKAPTKTTTSATTKVTKAPTKATTSATTKVTKAPTKATTSATTKVTKAPTKATTSATTKATTKATTTANNNSSSKKTTVKKASSDKKAVAAKAVKKPKTKLKSDKEESSESTSEEIKAVAAGNIDNTAPSTETSREEAETAPEAALNHSEWHRRSFAWLWIVLILAVAGLSYLRIRKLKNDGKEGKDLVLDFIPGVGDLVYAYSASDKKYAPIASDAQHGYSYNPAAGKKEIKQIEEEQERAAKIAERSATHTPIKRPKELSVNHAAFVAAGSAAAEKADEEKPEENKVVSPFKPAEGITRPGAVNPNEVFKTEVSHTTDRIMTSAFKPTAGSHTTEKIVTSAFKPVMGTHSSEKIVTSAVKPTSKFTPQRGPSATVKTTDSEAIRQARERAEAAREQQAMRAAMRTGRSVAEIKGEAKPAQTAPVTRPSAFGTNRAATNAAAAAAKPVFNPVVAPARSKAAPSNSNQLGNMLSGKSNNAAGRTPVWASRGTAGINPFKQAEDTVDAGADNISASESNMVNEDPGVQTSYADQAKTHKSAFFSRASAAKEAYDNAEAADSQNGSTVRPTTKIEGEHVRDTRYKPAVGSVLEGHKPNISNPGANVAPTATKPVFGFKPLDDK